MSFFVAVSLLCSAAAPQASVEPAAVQAIERLEQQLGDAMIRADVAQMRGMYADDFLTFGGAGEVIDRQKMLSAFDSSGDKLQWFENGPMDIQIFGDTALVHGSVKEKRIRNGKDVSGAYAWMDILQRRDGKWTIERSAGAKLTAGPETQDPADLEAVTHQQQKLGPAMVTGDFTKVDQSFAEDWAGIGSYGKLSGKAQIMDSLRTGSHKLHSFEMSPLKIRMLGNVALVQGAVHEERSDAGKDTSGNYLFMDLAEKRAGQWVIVRSLAARVH